MKKPPNPCEYSAFGQISPVKQIGEVSPNLYLRNVVLPWNVIHIGFTDHFQWLWWWSGILPQIEMFLHSQAPHTTGNAGVTIRLMTEGCSMKETTFICPPLFGHFKASTFQTFFRSTVHCCLLRLEYEERLCEEVEFQ